MYLFNNIMADPKNQEMAISGLPLQPLPPIAVKPLVESPRKNKYKIKPQDETEPLLPRKKNFSNTPNTKTSTPQTSKPNGKLNDVSGESPKSPSSNTPKNSRLKVFFNKFRESPKAPSNSTPETPMSNSPPDDVSGESPTASSSNTPKNSKLKKFFNRFSESPKAPKSNDVSGESSSSTLQDTVWKKIEPFMSKVESLSEKIEKLEKEKQGLEKKLTNMESNKTQSTTVNATARDQIKILEQKIATSNSRQQELLSKISKLQTVSANTSNPSKSVLALPNTSKTKDVEKIKEYIKEFQSHAAKLQTYKSEIITAFENQANNIYEQVKSANDGAKKKQGLQMILSRAKSALSQFKTKNLYFLIDKGFRNKADYLLEFDKNNYQKEVSILDTSVLEPFAVEMEKILTNTFVVTENTEDSDDLTEELESFKNELTVTKQKIYDIYNNNISIMDIVNTNFLVLYGLKFFRLLFTWFSLYLASKIFQEKYVKKVFANNEDPPDLRAFVGIFLGLEVAFMSAVFIFLVLLKYVFDKGGDFVINAAVLKRFMVDYLISTVFIIVFAILLASIMMKKKYFRYKVDGLRAIRGLQEIILYIASIISIIPFFLVI
jgi:hypothetical protein